MDISDYETILNNKIKKINRLIPYSGQTKQNLLNNYYKDIMEEISETKTIPADLELDNRIIAEKLVKSQEWPIKNASLKKRSLAFIIDLPFSLFVGFILYVLFIVIISFYDNRFFETTRSLFPALTIFILTTSMWLYGFLLYPLVFEGLFSTTVGKLSLGMIVIEDNGLKITWSQALIRSLTKLFPLLLLFETFIGFYQMKDSKRIMDTVATTRVIEISKTSVVDEYILKVRKIIPNHSKDLALPLEHLKNELEEILEAEGNKSPYEIYGSPEIVAKNIVQSNNFSQKNANLVFRSLAYVIDLVLSIVIGVLIMFIPVIFITSLDTYYFMYMTSPIKLLVFLFVVSIPLYSIIFYPMILEGYYSRTPGKWLFRIWTVDESGIKITWNQAVIRSLTKTIPILLFIEVFYMIKDRSTRRKLDTIALTRVVKSY